MSVLPGIDALGNHSYVHPKSSLINSSWEGDLCTGDVCNLEDGKKLELNIPLVFLCEGYGIFDIKGSLKTNGLTDFFYFRKICAPSTNQRNLDLTVMMHSFA